MEEIRISVPKRKGVRMVSDNILSILFGFSVSQSIIRTLAFKKKLLC